MLLSDRQSDASFLIHHFLSLYLRGEFAPGIVKYYQNKIYFLFMCETDVSVLFQHAAKCVLWVWCSPSIITVPSVRDW